MMTRRTFSTLLAGTVAAPGASLGQTAKGGLALYSGVGTELTHYGVDVGAESLTRHAPVQLPGGVQYAWPHPSRRFLYVTSSTGGPGQTGTDHHVAVFRIDPSSGALTAHGAPLRLRSRPFHNSVDRS